MSHSTLTLTFTFTFRLSLRERQYNCLIARFSILNNTRFLH